MKWEGVITALVALCALVAISSGIAWLVVRKNSLLMSLMGFSSCYLVGKNFWRFREENTNEDAIFREAVESPTRGTRIRTA